MKKTIHTLYLFLSKLADHWWYIPLVALLAALDSYLVIIPNEALLISAAIGRPKRWFQVALCGTLGSTLGAVSLAAITSAYGEKFIKYIFPNVIDSKQWIQSAAYIHNHGFWGLALVSLSPLPQQAAVIIVGLAHMPLGYVFTAVFLGRFPKYIFFCWAAVHAQKILLKVPIIGKRIKTGP